MIDLSRLAGGCVLVVGDVVLDEYMKGHVRRISPEAPVPVVEILDASYAPGGAGNVAANIASLGGQAYIAGVIGDDQQGEILRTELNKREIDLRCLISLPNRLTTTKSRVIARNQQVVRLDRETVRFLSPTQEEMLLDRVSTVINLVNACVLSDYAKGVLTPRVCQRVVEAARARGIPVVVDPKAVYFGKYQGATVITPNLGEAIAAASALDGYLAAEEPQPESDLFVERLGKVLSNHYECNILITRGSQGMSLVQVDQPTIHIPAEARQVYDVTGAGDTVVAALTLGLSAGLSLESAARLGNKAAGIVVGKVGTATVSLAELLMGELKASRNDRHGSCGGITPHLSSGGG